MWQEKQANIILPGQTSFTPERPQGTQVGNTIPPLPPGNRDSDLFGGSSRKRKSIPLDPPGSKSEEFSYPWKSNLQGDSSLLGSSGHGNQGMYLNQSKPAGPVNFRHHFDNQVHYENDFSDVRPSFNAIVQENGVEKSGTASYDMQSQSLEPNGNMHVGENHLVPIWQMQPSYGFSQTEVQRSLPIMNGSGANIGTSQDGFSFQNSTNFGTKNYVIPGRRPREMASSECSKQQSFVLPNRVSDGLNGKTCSQEDYKFENPCKLKKSVFCSNNGADDLQNVREAVGGSVCSEQDEKIRRLEYEMQSRSAPSDKFFDDHPENKEGNHAKGNIKVMQITSPTGAEKPKLALAGNNSSQNSCSHDNAVEHGQNNNLTCGPLKSDEKTRIHSEKGVCTVSEHLWDGTLQLSSSVTLSAAAYFKSGEKLLDINWPEFVEVKGKVRLEAFEKYIQDLPRSRNRGLMVISLCWKEGSSDTGLSGLKEVARGYKRGARVGFAQLSDGMDLYICPRSDTIITILAKYGFFKGMAVIDDNQDSLIGCVVWKKNRTSSSLAGEKIDAHTSSSKQPLSSTSGTSTLQEAESKFSPTKLAHESSQSAQAVFIPSSEDPENASKNGNESKNVDPNNFLPIPSVLPSNINSTHMPQQTTNNSYTSLPNPLDSLPFNSIRQAMLPAEDDDLPEYDFGVASETAAPLMNKPLQPPLPDSSVSIIHQGSENLSLPPPPPPIPIPIPITVNQPIPPLKQISASQAHVSVPEEKLVRAEASFEELDKKRKLFDDDDDMPEWCPPEHHNQSRVEITRPPTGASVENSNSTFHSLPSRPPLPSIPPPMPSDTRSAFSYQPFHPAFSNPPSITIRPPQPSPFQSSPSSSTGSNPNPAFGPGFQFANIRGHLH